MELQSALLIDSPCAKVEESSRSRAPLRVGLWISSSTLTRWSHKVITDIKNNSFADLVVVIRTRGSESGQGIAKRAFLFFRAYQWLDDHLFRVSPDAFEEVSIESLVNGCSHIQVHSNGSSEAGELSDKDVEKILGFDLDVVITFDSVRLEGRALHIAKHGVWKLDHAEEGPPGFWEVIEGRSTTASMLRILGDKHRGDKVIYRSHAMTDPRSTKINRSNMYWKSCRFVGRKLKELHERGPEVLESPPLDPADSLAAPVSRGVPGNGKMCSLLLSFGKRFLAAKTNHFLRWDQWILGFQMGDELEPPSPNLCRLQKVIPPRDRLWADPHPVWKDGRYFIFLEELIYQNRKGHLAVMEMDPTGTYKGPVTILEKPYHLSNPSVFEFQGNYYMVPETSKNKTLELYRCVEFPYRWELEKVLMEKVNAVDATLVEHDGRWWMFVNLADEDTSDNYDDLFLFHAATPLGPWREHQLNPIKSDVRSARPAGRPFRWRGDWYRPAQDCSRRYGHAVSINKIIQWDRREYQEVEVSKILPQWCANLVGTHTLNHCTGLTVVDGLLRRRKFP